jgi:hypothetical protein
MATGSSAASPKTAGFAGGEGLLEAREDKLAGDGTGSVAGSEEGMKVPGGLAGAEGGTKGFLAGGNK